jgi:CRISPR/Cas system-associated endonuclease Cas1
MTTSVLTYDDTTTTSSIGQDYGNSCDTYQELADKKQEQKDTIVLAGYGCGLSVSRDALICKQGFTHDPQNGSSKTNQAQTLYRGVHGIKSIVILSDSGNISLDAIRWASSENITISLIDRDGSLQQTLTPEQTANASLRRKQYQADASKIAYRLICKKVQAQQELLANHPELPDSERALEIFSDSLKWLELPDLPRWNDIDYMRTFEGRLAKAYFEAIEGVSIKFEKAYSKLVPPHWKQVSTRTSPLSHNHGARHAPRLALPICPDPHQ